LAALSQRLQTVRRAHAPDAREVRLDSLEKILIAERSACSSLPAEWMFTTEKARAKMGRAYPVTSKES
jgi:hypothetical protein